MARSEVRDTRSASRLEGMETGGTRIRVVPGSAGRWEVREPGSSRALIEVDSPTVAVQRARKLLSRGGTVEVLDQTGRLLETQVAPPPSANPWRYMPPKRLFWVLGVLFLVQSILRLAAEGFDWLTLGFGCLGAFYLTCLTASHRRHSRNASDAHESTAEPNPREDR